MIIMIILMVGGEEGLVFMNFLIGVLDINGEVDGVLDIDVWKRFQSEGVLDILFFECKDCVVLYVWIVVLEVEVKIVIRILSVFEFMYDKVK